jgi:hypothetical protein
VFNLNSRFVFISTDYFDTGDACDPDIDGDGAANSVDNCPYLLNTLQTDINGECCLKKLSLILYFIGKLDIFPLMCLADKVLITELTLIHKNIRPLRNLHAKKMILILNIICQCEVNDKNNNASFEDLDIHYY